MSKFLPTHLGAEPKKLAILGGLVAVGLVVFWINREPDSAPASSTPSTAATRPTKIQPEVPALPASPAEGPRLAQRGTSRGSGNLNTNVEDFKPSLKRKEGVDIASIDPSLKLDLIAQLQGAEINTSSRSLFEFGQAPPPPLPKVAPIVPKPVTAPPPEAPKPTEPVKPPPPPPPPPIPLKYYGYAGMNRSGLRQAFFLDGEDILIAAENQTIKNRYRIVRIGVRSAEVEDTSSKSQQNLPLVEEGL